MSVQLALASANATVPARVIVASHAFIQNLRRGFYDLGTDVLPASRLADAFAELALVI